MQDYLGGVSGVLAARLPRCRRRLPRRGARVARTRGRTRTYMVPYIDDRRYGGVTFDCYCPRLPATKLILLHITFHMVVDPHDCVPAWKRRWALPPQEILNWLVRGGEAKRRQAKLAASGGAIRWLPDRQQPMLLRAHCRNRSSKARPEDPPK